MFCGFIKWNIVRERYLYMFLYCITWNWICKMFGCQPPVTITTTNVSFLKVNFCSIRRAEGIKIKLQKKYLIFCILYTPTK